MLARHPVGVRRAGEPDRYPDLRAGRLRPAVANASPIFVPDAPDTISDRMSKSIETDWSAAFVLATRDWLEPSALASCACVQCRSVTLGDVREVPAGRAAPSPRRA